MALIQEISSKENQFIKLAKSLHQKKQREELALMLLEGKKLISEAIKKNIKLKFVFTKDQSIIEELGINELDEIEIYIGDEELMSKISTTDTAPPIIAIAEQPKSQNPLKIKSEEKNSKDIFLYCDTIRDPGNLGSIIRTAFAAGIKAIYISPESADIYNTKTLRSSMGAVFYGDIKYIGFDDLLNEFKDYIETKKTSLEIIGTSPYASKNYNEISNLCPLKTFLVVVGNEADGLNQTVSDKCTEFVKIPLQNGIESINVLAATSVILFDLSSRWKSF